MPEPTLNPYLELNTTHATLDQLSEFDEIIDVRTPLEYADDHIPGALNAPVLSNEERVTIGTLYVQVSPFEATRLGAALVAANIARHLQGVFADRPRRWRPLIYCWRGGKRSGSMATWFKLIGWQARQLEGGYKTYRRWVLASIDELPAQFSYIVLNGPTGTGKTRLLAGLRDAGAQVLDLEGLARHRGSLLGALPNTPQPTQKSFQSALIQTLSGFDPKHPVFVEAESARIGAVDLPKSLISPMHAGTCVNVCAPVDARLEFLLQDYRHLFEQPGAFKQQLARLVGLHSRKTIERWHALIDQDERTELFRELIEQHYDPAYARSSRQHFLALEGALQFDFHPNTDTIRDQAVDLLASLDQTATGPIVPSLTSSARID
ncbi:MAG: tRNA 2-selenouridine(34) synthase MnmH [Alcaligenaceae bacterium]|nr:tRNA 2-selenouridine(34) synthase MnmH [Alcaligenaceae bacterium]